MSETRATTPAFPPGRYGRRRERRRPTALIACGVLVLAASVLLAVWLYDRYGDPDYDARVVGWTDVSPASMTIEFTVRVPAGGAAQCILRARAYDGSEVGRRTVTVTAPGGSTSAEGREPVPTTARASHGDVLRCRPPA